MRAFALLLAVGLSGPAWAEDAPTLGGGRGMDLVCEPMPGEAPGHFVCEDPDSYARCKALEGKGAVRIEGESRKTPVVQCRQGG